MSVEADITQGIGMSRRRILAIGAVAPVAALATGGALGGLGLVDPAAAARPAVTLPQNASAFVSVPPSRLADTRPDRNVGGYTRIDANTIRVQIAGRGGVPATATAAVLNVTAVNTTQGGFVSVYPSGSTLPNISTLNVEGAGQVIPNLVTVRLGDAGSVDVYTQSPADLIVDVNGAYTPVTDVVSAGRFVGLQTAFRAIDTRTLTKVGIGGVQRVDVSAVVPATASAVVVNLTVTESNGAGFWTGYAAGGAQPNSSSLNTDDANQTRANQAILPIGTFGAKRGIDVFSSSGGHLVVDVAGYFTGTVDAVGSDGLFVPNAPYRTLDTRQVPNYGRMYAGWVAEFNYTGSATSQAVVVNLTTSETRGAGYFTGYPARTDRPLASNLNASTKNQTVANHAILRVSTAGVAVYTQTGGDLIVDVAGYYIGTPVAATLPQVVNIIPPPPPPSALPYVLVAPNLGKPGHAIASATVLEGVTSNIVDPGNVGHWPGTGFAGEQSHMVLFAHRTTNIGPFYNLHLLGAGDQISLTGSDGRVFHYGFVRRDLTSANAQEIYNVGLVAPIPSVSLVACSQPNFLPTNTKYRIVVTFTLLSVDE
ncbi:MAG: hypothetical protein JWM34_911 [Ilumatobacteraceae bacterium]|nr:hypothetical protein [Ilumatobacteraceae bacterium]